MHSSIISKTKPVPTVAAVPIVPIVLRTERLVIQQDGRIRRWAQIDEMDGRYLRVILLPDEETVHNAFFDRTFRP